jgi:ATP-binding cassette subfamily B protein
MNFDASIHTSLKRLWSHISFRRRGQFALLLVLMLLTSFAEVLTIGAVLPFLGVLTAPERIFELPFAQPIIETLKFTEPKQLLLPLTIIFGLAVLIAGMMRLFMLGANTRLSFATGADLSIQIYRHTLYQPYEVHCERNSSKVIDGISGKADEVIYRIIVPTLTLISSIAMIVAILIALLIVQPIIALVAFSGFGLIYIAIISLTRKQLMIDSECVARESTQVIKSLQEGLGGIRDVLIDGTQEAHSQVYQNADSRLRRAQGNGLFVSASPRYGMEALGMLLIAVLAYSLAHQADGIAEAIPVLGALALGAQRLLPVMQQAYGSWAQINIGQASLKDVLELLDQPLPAYFHYPVIPMPFNQTIALKEISFRYGKQGDYVLNQINLNIVKGSRVGFIGPTGGGKSTLLDIVMGLLQPTIGMLQVDGQTISPINCRSWQAHVAHVPQAIFLADSTIEENIAFGIPRNQIDHARVRRAAEQAQISLSIESWPNQYQTFVGERGIRLSGGQRQRIGIARALYKQADVIIFDEATSALDSETENDVMRAIEGLSNEITLLIIAHRLTTLKNCTQIIELCDGGIRQSGSYQEIIKKSIV